MMGASTRTALISSSYACVVAENTAVIASRMRCSGVVDSEIALHMNVGLN